MPVRISRASVTVAPDRAPVRISRAGVTVAATLTAAAGPDVTVDGLDVVTLDGTGSSGAPTVWAWTQTGGAAVTLLDSDTAQPTFVAPGTLTGGTYTFQLVVGNGTATSAPDSVAVRVYPHVEWRDIAGAWVPVRTRILDAPVVVTPPSLGLRGLNLPDAAFDEAHLPGTFGTNYVYPLPATIAAMWDHGHRLFRIPFRWERIQPTLRAPLDAVELARLVGAVNAITAAGGVTVIDPHQRLMYGALHFGDPGAFVSADFADLWVRLSDAFKGNGAVQYGLMNEPTGARTQAANDAWKVLAQDAVDAIRENGDSNWIWVGSYTSSALGAFTDPVLGFGSAPFVVDDAARSGPEVHDYFDPTGTYVNTYATELATTSGDATDPRGGVFADTLHKKIITRLRLFLDWLKINGQAGFIGEWGIPRDDAGDAEHVADAAKWAALADRWWQEIDAYTAQGVQVSVAQWAGGPSWSADYNLRMYANDNTAYLPGQVGERHLVVAPVGGGGFGVSFGESFGA